MAALSKILRSVEDGQIAFWCPGCREAHAVRISGSGATRDGWSWNGNVERPTFAPSVLVRSGHYADGFKPGSACWCTYARENPGATRFSCGRCHLFVTDGRIRFLDDCSHDLAGQTVDIPPWPAGRE